MDKEYGFTLIELMIAVAIIAILVAVASVRTGEQIIKAKDGKAVLIMSSWRNANHLNYADSGIYVTSFGALELKVDNQTISLTYSNNSKSVFNNNLSTEWTQAGKSNDSNNMVSFTITGNSLESNIVFDNSNGNDTKGIAWNTY